jgi:hypothetical protein
MIADSQSHLLPCTERCQASKPCESFRIKLTVEMIAPRIVVDGWKKVLKYSCAWAVPKIPEK